MLIEGDILKKVKSFFNYGIKMAFLFFFILLVNIRVGSDINEVNSGVRNRVTNLALMSLQIEESKKNDIYNSVRVLTGDLTGYGANCPLCSGRLACKPSYYVKDGTDTYVDSEYGKVNIVASSSNLACGSVVRFSSKLSNEPMYAIVLDRGVLGNDLDLLTPSESYASKHVGRSSITYEVLRDGWLRNNES